MYADWSATNCSARVASWQVPSLEDGIFFLRAPGGNSADEIAGRTRDIAGNVFRFGDAGVDERGGAETFPNLFYNHRAVLLHDSSQMMDCGRRRRLTDDLG